MGNLQKVVYLSEAQAQELFTNETITVDGVTVNYSADDLYLTPDDSGNFVLKTGDTMTGALKAKGLRTYVSDTNGNASLNFGETADSTRMGRITMNTTTNIMEFDEGNERYLLPAPTASSETLYDILTSKTAVSVAQGGTGAVTAAAALTNLGAVAKSGDTMTGSLNVPGLNVLGNYPVITFRQSAGSTPTGYITENNTTRRMYFTVVPTDAGGNEVFNLPAPSTGNTSQQNFDILTTKSSVTVAQGGTGAQTATAALSNLGGLAKSGGTMTGPLILAAEPNEELEAATKHYVDAIAAATGSGTVTSVRVAATSPVVSSSNTAQSVSLNTTISLADNYGDTKNPYASKTKNYVLAAPSDANGAPSFRTLVAADIPSLSITDKTTGTLTVGRGGTGVASFTANSVIMSGSTTTAALTTRAVTNMTSVGMLALKIGMLKLKFNCVLPTQL